MKSIVNLFVVAVVSCMVLMAYTQKCTPTTCPPGPVMVNFQYSNCTGDRSYYAYTSTESCTSASEGYSTISFYDQTGIWTYLDINNPTCDLTLSNMTYSERSGYSFGTCIVGGVVSKRDQAFGFERSSDASLMISGMYLSSVNASFVSPQEPQEPGNPKNLTTMPSREELCYSANNCTLPDGSTPTLYVTALSETGNCLSGYESSFSNAVIGQCYYFGEDFYAALQCNGLHGYDLVFYVDDDCARAFFLQGYTTNCNDPNAETINYCTAPYTPVNPPPPSSSASVLSLGSIVVIFAIVLALVY